MNRNIPEEVLLNTVIWEEMGDDWKQRCINKNIDLKRQIIKTNSKKIQVMQLCLLIYDCKFSVEFSVLGLK